MFDFMDIEDPTAGLVDYVDRTTAMGEQYNLTSCSKDSVSAVDLRRKRTSAGLLIPFLLSILVHAQGRCCESLDCILLPVCLPHSQVDHAVS